MNPQRNQGTEKKVRGRRKNLFSLFQIISPWKLQGRVMVQAWQSDCFISRCSLHCYTVNSLPWSCEGAEDQFMDKDYTEYTEAAGKTGGSSQILGLFKSLIHVSFSKFIKCECKDEVRFRKLTLRLAFQWEDLPTLFASFSKKSSSAEAHDRNVQTRDVSLLQWFEELLLSWNLT